MSAALSTVPVLVLGAGSWGTALAALACQRASTLIWARNADSAAHINQHHQLPRYLPQVDLPSALTATDDFAAAMRHVLGDDSGYAVDGGEDAVEKNAVDFGVCIFAYSGK